MDSIEQTLQHNLAVLGTGRELARMAQRLLHAYPDPGQLAISEAARILRKHTGKDLDPQSVWWHQFSGASSSGRSFTGWAHNQAPTRSMRFPELMIERFEPAFQEASDELSVYSGFYRQGPHASRFDELNEVAVLPRDVQADFWALNFAQAYRQQVDAFWAEQADHFAVLAKVNLLGQCVVAQREGRISPEDTQQLRTWLGLSDAQLTLAQLREQAVADGALAEACELGAVSGACLYVLQGAGSGVLLYLPWAEQPLQAFASRQALAQWLREQLANTEQVARFKRGLVADPHDAASLQAVGDALAALRVSDSDEASLVLLEGARKPVGPSFFAFVTEQARNQMQSSAARMTDNSQLRKAMWRGYLGAFLQVFGGFVPMGWPVSLGLLGVTLAKLGLDIDAAVHAGSAQQRQAAMRAAILDSVFAALSMVDVGAGSSMALLSYQTPFHELQTSLADWEVVEAPSAGLDGIEANEVLDAKPLGQGRLQGVRMGTDGSCWIELEGVPYRVRYSPETSSWLIVPADNPFAFGPLRPVRLNAEGEWELLAPPRLAGGAPTGNLASEPSAFWDEYMRPDALRERTLSDNARARQEALLGDQDIPELDDEDDPQVDDNGFDYVDDGGTPAYTYQQDGRYKNHLILMYTEEDSQINRFLREGVRDFPYGDEVDYVTKLADDLERLPKNSDVPLYRGGHGLRSTSGTHFRNGQFNVGDVLVNTDLTSFTENPYVVRQFAADNNLKTASGVEGVFDDTSVVFELPAGSYRNGTPVSAFSGHANEAETLFVPGSYFRIDSLREIRGAEYHFVNVRLSEVAAPASGPVYDLRTGQLFDRAAYAARLNDAGLVERFFD